MPSTRRQKTKERKSRDADLFSDIEYMDVMLGSPHFGDLDDDFRNEFVSEGRNNRPSSSQGNEIRSIARKSVLELAKKQPSRENIDFLSDEVGNRVSRETDGIMDSVNIQVKKAVNEAVNS